MCCEFSSDECLACCLEIVSALKFICHLLDLICNYCVKYHHWECDGLCWTNHSELELVACECKWWCSVSICGIHCKCRKCWCTWYICLALWWLCSLTLLDDLLNDRLELLSKECWDDCWRCLVSSKSVIISCWWSRKSQKLSVVVYCCQNRCQEELELEICLRMLTWIDEVLALVCWDRPVVVLTWTIYTGKWLLMEYALKVMLCSDLLHGCHNQMVLICGDVGCWEDWCKLMLCRCNLIVLCLCKDAVLPQLLVQLCHVWCDLILDRCEILIIKLLSLWRHCSEKCTSAELKICSLCKFLLIYQEVLLLRTNWWSNLLGCCVAEHCKSLKGFLADGIHWTEKRCLVVKWLSCIWCECCRDTEDTCSLICCLYKCWWCTIPCCISSCSTCLTKTAWREWWSIRLWLDELLACELKDNAAITDCAYEWVVLLCCCLCKWLEPMCIMCCTKLHCPFLHGCCNWICDWCIERLALVNSRLEWLVNCFWKSLSHDLIWEYVWAKYGWNFVHHNYYSFSWLKWILNVSSKKRERCPPSWEHLCPFRII